MTIQMHLQKFEREHDPTIMQEENEMDVSLFKGIPSPPEVNQPMMFAYSFKAKSHHTPHHSLVLTQCVSGMLAKNARRCYTN